MQHKYKKEFGWFWKESDLWTKHKLSVRICCILLPFLT